ncbi:MAG: DUF433 domain-containing protein [Vicinamibacterales bacterium]
MSVVLSPELARRIAELAAQSGQTAEFALRETVAAYGSQPVLDWSQCPIVERVPGRVSGAWVFRDTRLPVATVFENLEAGATVDEVAQWFDIPADLVRQVIDFAARSLHAPAPAP